MTKYFCKKCNGLMQKISEDINNYTKIIRCQICKTEIIVDEKDDIG